MLTTESILDLLKNNREYLAREFGVSKIGLFGSCAADRQTPESDIDLVVDFSRPIGFRFFDLIDYLERTLGCKVDLLTSDGVENIRSARVSSGILRSIRYV